MIFEQNKSECESSDSEDTNNYFDWSKNKKQEISNF
jgi:hypothetical protein